MKNSILPSLTFLTYSLGCRTNQAEIEEIGKQLASRRSGLTAYGFIPYNTLCRSEALKLCSYPSVVLLNTCVVTAKAEKETRQKIRELRKKYPNSFLVVLGCAVTAKEKFKIELPEADLLISNENKDKTVKHILTYLRHSELVEESLSKSKRKRSLHSLRLGRDDNSLNNKYIASGRKFIKIQDGCDRFCTFCLTCHLRGKPTSVPLEKVIKEVNYWVDRGVKEIILTGINLGLYRVIATPMSHRKKQSQSSYNNPTGLSRHSGIPPVGGDFVPRNDIVHLVKTILSQTKVERISFSSIYPEMLLPLNRSDLSTGRTCLTNNPRVSQYIHLSLQSGSQTVLQRMNRHNQINELTNCLLQIKRKNPCFTFKADIIVGFPNETEKEFQETLDFVKKAKISFAHIFTYSARKGTVAYEMLKQAKRSPSEAQSAKEEKWQEVPAEIKKQRIEKLRKEVEKIRSSEAKIIISKILNCLMVKWLNGYWEGITENGWPIRIKYYELRIKGKSNIKGEIVPVKIISFKDNYLLGNFCLDEERRRF